MKWREEHGRRFRNGGYGASASIFDFHPVQKGFVIRFKRGEGKRSHRMHDAGFFLDQGVGKKARMDLWQMLTRITVAIRMTDGENSELI